MACYQALPRLGEVGEIFVYLAYLQIGINTLGGLAAYGSILGKAQKAIFGDKKKKEKKAE